MLPAHLLERLTMQEPPRSPLEAASCPMPSAIASPPAASLAHVTRPPSNTAAQAGHSASKSSTCTLALHPRSFCSENDAPEAMQGASMLI